MESKNQKELEKFSAYCKANPDLRFFQALLNYCDDNFAKKLNQNINFIYFGKNKVNTVEQGLIDTYYIE